MQYAVLSKKGSRETNEDYAAVTVKDGAYCFVLCDGLGGHGAGEEASRLAVETILEGFTKYPSLGQTGTFLEMAQERLLQEQERLHIPNDMKTTAVVLVTEGQQAEWAHIGDSRLYHFRDTLFGTRFVRTLDHSVPQTLVASGQLKEREIRFHEDRNRLLRALGTEWNGKAYEVSKPVPAGRRDRFLLCSDGWWELIEEHEMIALMKRSAGPKDWLTRMEEAIVKHGAGRDMDNYSAVGVWLK